MLNRNKERLLGKPLVIFISSVNRPYFHSLLDKLRRESQISELELDLQPHNQSPLSAQISVTNIHDDSQPFSIFLWSLRNSCILQKAPTKPQQIEALPENSPEQLSAEILRSPNQPRSGNQLLNALPDAEYQSLVPYLESVNLNSGQILFQPGESITEVYFPHQAIISLALKIAEKSTTEITMIGNQGMVGLPVILGSQSTTNYGIVQIPGSAMKLSADILKSEFHRGGSLQKLLLLYTQTQLIQISQLAVCRAHHSIPQRFTRWLLSVDDCHQQENLPLTHKFIAQMMGVRRASITNAAQELQKQNIISYGRGKITIRDRAALESMTCECYGKIKSVFPRLLD